MKTTAINERLAAALGVSYLGLRLAQEMNRLLFGNDCIGGTDQHYRNKVETALAGLADCQNPGATVDSTARAMFETFHRLNNEEHKKGGYSVEWDGAQAAADPKSEWIIWAKWLHGRFTPPPATMEMLEEIIAYQPTPRAARAAGLKRIDKLPRF